MRDSKPIRQLRVRSTPLSVSFSEVERDTVVQAATLSAESVSAFIRAAAVKAAERTVKKRAA